MIKLSDYRTEAAFPSEMKTVERAALAYAYDRQKKIFLEHLQCVYIWADLEKVDDNKLDFLAVECRVLFYNSGLSPDVKRKLIQNSIYWYMKLGTRQAMEEMIDIVFGNENTTVEEWYTYAGEPFHFRIAVGTTVTQTSIKEFLSYLNTIKNARSRFDYLVFQNGITLTLYQQSEYEKLVYTFCGDFECGTYPDISVGFQPAEVAITLEGDGMEAWMDYTESGTTPDTSIGFAKMETKFDLLGESVENNFTYSTDSETESGTAPDISVGTQFNEVQAVLESASGENQIIYSSDVESESGSIPDPAVGFMETESGVSVSTESAGHDLYYSTDADKYAADE